MPQNVEQPPRRNPHHTPHGEALVLFAPILALLILALTFYLVRHGG